MFVFRITLGHNPQSVSFSLHRAVDLTVWIAGFAQLHLQSFIFIFALKDSLTIFKDSL